MYTIRMTILVFLVIGTLSAAGCGGRPRGSVSAHTPVPVTVAPGERATEYDAGQAIRGYASRVLDISVQVKSAGGRKGAIILPSVASYAHGIQA